jgi:hypothetical protein
MIITTVATSSRSHPRCDSVLSRSLRMKRIASIWVAAALLMLAVALPAQAQTNSVATPSARGATPSAPSVGEAGTPAMTRKPAANKAAHLKKKKSSFVHRMRDKAVQQFQKLLGSKKASPSGPE